MKDHIVETMTVGRTHSVPIMPTEAKPWFKASLGYVTRLQRSGIRIKALKLTDEQATDLEAATGQKATMWGCPVVVADPAQKDKRTP